MRCNVCHGRGSLPYGVGQQPCSGCDGSGAFSVAPCLSSTECGNQLSMGTGYGRIVCTAERGHAGPCDAHARRRALRTMRAQAIEDGCTATVVLTTIALGEVPSEDDLQTLPHPEATARYAAMTAHEALAEIAARPAQVARAHAKESSFTTAGQLVCPPEVALRPMNEAPTTGPVVEILVATTDRAGCDGWLIAHYADGGGEDQPRFRGWFFWTGFDFHQVETSKLLGWLPLPSIGAYVKGGR